MGVRIESDGTALGTHVFDDDNKEMSGIVRMSWNVELHKPAVANLVVTRVPISIRARYVREIHASLWERFKLAFRIVFKG